LFFYIENRVTRYYCHDIEREGDGEKEIAKHVVATTTTTTEIK
jgi:hypothetical protein